MCEDKHDRRDSVTKLMNHGTPYGDLYVTMLLIILFETSIFWCSNLHDLLLRTKIALQAMPTFARVD